MRMLEIKLSTGAIAIAATCGIAGGEPLTKQPSPDEIVRALEAPLTRSLSAKPVGTMSSEEEQLFIDSLSRKDTRSLSVSERKRLEDISDRKPTIDLTMEFPFNSSALLGDALVTAHNLGKALTSPQMRGKTFLLAGHTDAKGSDAVNQPLSERRANAVKAFLVRNYGVRPETLIAVGYGEMKLKNADDPNAAENRRVQTVNMLPYAAANQQ